MTVDAARDDVASAGVDVARPRREMLARATIFSPETPMSQRIVSAAVATMPLRMVRSSGSIRVPGAWWESRRSITRQKTKRARPGSRALLNKNGCL